MQSAPQALTLSAVVEFGKDPRDSVAQRPHVLSGYFYLFAAAEKPPHGASHGGLNLVLLLPLRHPIYCTPGKQTSRFQSFIGILLHKAPPPLCGARHVGRHVCLLHISGLGSC